MRTPIGTGLIAIAAAALLFSQAQPRKPRSAARVSIDAIVTDASGHLVRDLSASDFEVSWNGEPQTVESAAYVPSHGAAPEPDASFQVLPPTAWGTREINAGSRWTLVLLLDDLRLSAATRAQVRRAAARFIDEQMQPGDSASIVRTTGGSGALQQLTSDKRLLHAALDLLAPQPPGGAPTTDLKREDSLAGATQAILRTVLDGLRVVVGRKAVLMFSENLKLYQGAHDLLALQTADELMASRANRSSVVFYTVDPRGPQSPGQIPASGGVGELARDTGGIFFDNTNDAPTVMARVLQDQEGCYRIAFFSDSPGDTVNSLLKGIAVKVKRPGLHVRARTEFVRSPETEAPDRDDTPLSMLLPAQPFASGGIHMSLTPLVSYAAASTVDLLVPIDAKDIAFTSDVKGGYNGALEAAAVAILASGEVAGSIQQGYTIQMPAGRYAAFTSGGEMTAALRLPLHAPGPMQVHVLVRDATSGRVGSARQFLDFPDMSGGRLAISGLFLRDSGAEEAGERERSVMRVFQPGQRIEFTYAIYNARVDAEKRARLDVRVRVLRDGAEIFAGPLTTDASTDSDPARRVRRGGLLLHEAKPGHYQLELSVTDNASTPQRAATQSIDFEVAARN